MSEDRNADEPSATDESTDSVNRRRFVKAFGAAGSVGLLGLGTGQASARRNSVSRSRAGDIARRSVSQAALNTAKADLGVSSFQLSEATEQKIDGVPWVQIPVSGINLFAYNTKQDTTEIKPDSNTLVRARLEDDEVTIERLKIGGAVTEEALQTLAHSADWNKALENGGVVTVNADDAAAHLDQLSGVSRVFVPVELETGDETMLIAEIDEEGRLSSVYGFVGKSDGVTTQQSAIDCFANCIPISAGCTQVCYPCVSAPNQFTCAPCAVCLGAVGTACAVKCGAEQLL